MPLTRRTVRIAIIVVLVIAGLAWATRTVMHKDPISVLVQNVALGNVESVVANTRAGTVNACRRAKLAPTIGGKIQRLPVHKGDRVKAGQVLVELWNDDLIAQVTLAENELHAAHARRDEACLNAANAEREAARSNELQKKGLVSDDILDRAVTMKQAQAAACAGANSNVEVSQSRIAAAHAALERTVLKAPFAGYIAELNGELGEYVTPSPPGIPTPPAVDLVDTSCLYIAAPIDEVDAPKIRTGMPARITLDAFPGKSFKGTVRRIAPYVLEAEKQARTVDVEAVFDDPLEYKDLLPGYSADLEVVLDIHPNVLRVPTESVLEGKKILLLRDGVIEERRIETGLANWKVTEVKTGVAAGDSVIVSVGREGVKAGAAAKIESAPGE
ncbi:MAG: efflux RND transporter periplasmic adaptor subunit [Gammaproteobacteria bacterium]|nr:efflux RND transporter periplasmic adaptor subunit [Gammaproteobacteria bacterium]